MVPLETRLGETERCFTVQSLGNGKYQTSTGFIVTKH
jgi:hypothetical protein